MKTQVSGPVAVIVILIVVLVIVAIGWKFIGKGKATKADTGVAPKPGEAPGAMEMPEPAAAAGGGAVPPESQPPPQGEGAAMPAAK